MTEIQKTIKLLKELIEAGKYHNTNVHLSINEAEDMVALLESMPDYEKPIFDVISEFHPEYYIVSPCYDLKIRKKLVETAFDTLKKEIDRLNTELKIKNTEIENLSILH